MLAYRPCFQQQAAGGHGPWEADGPCTPVHIFSFPSLFMLLVSYPIAYGRNSLPLVICSEGTFVKMRLGPLSACLTQVILTNCLQTSTLLSTLFTVTVKPLAQREEGMWKSSPWKSLFSLLLGKPRQMAISCGPRGICFLALGQLCFVGANAVPPAAMDNRGYGLWKGDTELKAEGRLQN